MHAPATELFQRIQQFSLDQIDANLPFSKRLARDHGWTLDYAQRVIEEYKKFVFLAVVAGNPVTPSDQVDQVWHLHLLYTQSYWEEFCPKVLQTPLHHNPTKGGQQERGKFNDWYTGTLESYDRWFGVPPADIWSPPHIRFGREIHFQRVNTLQHWILPKPDFSQFFSASWLREWVWLGLMIVLGIFLWELPAVATTTTSPLAFSFDAFLPVYGLGALLTTTGFVGSRVLLWRSPFFRAVAPLLFAAGMLGLFLLSIIRPLIGWADLAGYEFVGFYGLAAIAGMIADLATTNWLKQRSSNLLRTRHSSIQALRWLPFLSLVFLYGLGISRIGLGIYRNKPTGLLVMLSLGMALYLLWRTLYSARSSVALPGAKSILTGSIVVFAVMLFFLPSFVLGGLFGLGMCFMLHANTNPRIYRSSSNPSYSNHSSSGTTCVNGSCGVGGGSDGGGDGGCGGCGGCGE